jgi:hypothetical protein
MAQKQPRAAEDISHLQLEDLFIAKDAAVELTAFQGYQIVNRQRHPLILSLRGITIPTSPE